MMLQSMDYRADVVANGLEAVEALSRVPYAAVLMDVRMPEMDGHEATAEIRRREQRTGHHVPIIAMTADAMEGDRERALASGMDDYLAKPVLREALSEVLARWIPKGAPEGARPSFGNGHAGAAAVDAVSQPRRPRRTAGARRRGAARRARRALFGGRPAAARRLAQRRGGRRRPRRRAHRAHPQGELREHWSRRDGRDRRGTAARGHLRRPLPPPG